jgi:hypothetical protein
MKVFATHVSGSDGPGFRTVFRQLAFDDQNGVHQLTEDPAEADIILFLDVNEHQGDLRISAIARHPLTRRFPEKTFVYSELDQPWCAMPGLYVSMPRKGFDHRRQRACGYITPLINSYVKSLASEAPCPTMNADLLFSFIGRRSDPSREAVLALRHSRAIVEDSSQTNIFGGGADAEYKKRRYAEILARSKFVLCPRGAGTASFRLFEAMALGRVPVILSDDWVAPNGPDWAAFSLRVCEAEAASVPALLERSEPRFEQMASEALRQWDQWFSPGVLFHRMVEACGELLVARRLPETVAQKLPNARYLRLRAREIKSQLRRIFDR